MGYAADVIAPVVNESNCIVGCNSKIIRLLGVIRLENTSSCRFAVENERLELFVTVPCMSPFCPLYMMDDSTKELKNVIAATLEIVTIELKMFMAPERSIYIFCFAA